MFVHSKLLQLEIIVPAGRGSFLLVVSYASFKQKLCH